MKQNPDAAAGWVPQLVVVKDGGVIDNVLLHGKEVFVLGRHQNCDIVAGHASISRHHLEIRVSCSSRELLLTDLRSVHGTKINGKAMKTLEAVPIHEDDKVQLGASTRTYMVKWIPVTPDASDSSSSSCTPAHSVDSSIMKGLEEEFQSVLRLQKSPAASGKHPESARRLAFADLNGRSPRSNSTNSAVKSSRMSGLGTSPMSNKKAAAGLESPKPKKVGGGIPKSPDFRKTAVPESPELRKTGTPEFQKVGKARKAGVPESPRSKECLADSKLWLRRCNSNPLPAINTTNKVPQTQRLPVFKENADDILGRLQSCEQEDEYPSDKENVAPAAAAEKALTTRKSSSSSLVEREPFKQLFYLPSPAAQAEYKPVFEPPPFSSSDDDSLTCMEDAILKNNRKQLMLGTEQSLLRKQKHSGPSDLRKQWHIVVDTNCFIDEASFDSLKQLEGIKETRVLIPKIVIRELDHLKRTKSKESRARAALRWIEKCMVNAPWWIHVQNSYETRPVGTTPPVSPSFLGRDFSQYGSAMDLLSPTNDDHILDCALLFERSILEGKVVLLTNDTALKIKAMAEGMCCEGAKSFCSSLLSPYSDRFLWAGSTALTTPRSPDGMLLLGKAHSGNNDHQPPRGLQVVLES